MRRLTDNEEGLAGLMEASERERFDAIRETTPMSRIWYPYTKPDEKPSVNIWASFYDSTRGVGMTHKFRRKDVASIELRINEIMRGRVR